jgi:hypothetical protein
MGDDEEGASAQLQAKTTTGLEGKDGQVKEPAESMTMEMDES